MGSSEKQQTRRQHTVPRCYLRRFTSDGEALWVFDKVTKKVRQSNVMGVAWESHFYDLPDHTFDELPPNMRDLQVMEAMFARAEAAFTQAIQKMIDWRHPHPDPMKTRREFAMHVTMQWLRTRARREEIFQSHQAALQALANQFCEQLGNGGRVRVECKRDNLALLHAGYMLNEDFVVELASALNKHMWFLGVNNTLKPLYTSDQPIVTVAHLPPGTGIRAPGIEIAFPLSSRHVFVALERNHHADVKHMEGTEWEMCPEDVERYNRLQVQQSHRVVLCEQNPYDLAMDECALNPEICDLNRQRAEGVHLGNLIGLFHQP